MMKIWKVEISKKSFLQPNIHFFINQKTKQ